MKRLPAYAATIEKRRVKLLILVVAVIGLAGFARAAKMPDKSWLMRGPVFLRL